MVMENKGRGSHSVQQQLPEDFTCKKSENEDEFTAASAPIKDESVVGTNQSDVNETFFKDREMILPRGRAARDVFDIVQWLEVQVSEKECDERVQLHNDQTITVDDNDGSNHSWTEKWVKLGKRLKNMDAEKDLAKTQPTDVMQGTSVRKSDSFKLPKLQFSSFGSKKMETIESSQKPLKERLLEFADRRFKLPETFRGNGVEINQSVKHSEPGWSLSHEFKLGKKQIMTMLISTKKTKSSHQDAALPTLHDENEDKKREELNMTLTHSSSLKTNSKKRDELADACMAQRKSDATPKSFKEKMMELVVRQKQMSGKDNDVAIQGTTKSSSIGFLFYIKKKIQADTNSRKKVQEKQVEENIDFAEEDVGFAADNVVLIEPDENVEFYFDQSDEPIHQEHEVMYEFEDLELQEVPSNLENVSTDKNGSGVKYGPIKWSYSRRSNETQNISR